MTVAVALTLSGCEGGGTVSTLSPDQAVDVGGRLVGPDGKPVASTRVVMYRDPGITETIGNLFVISASLGIACLSDNGPQLCRDARKTTSGADGKFDFKMTGKDTYDNGITIGSSKAGTFVISSALPAARDEAIGPGTTATFQVNVATLQLPDLRFWHPSLAYTGHEGADPALTFDGLPADYGGGPHYDADFEDAAGDVIWDFPDARSAAPLDRRLLEDLTGSVAVRAHAAQTTGGTSFVLDHRSQTIRFAGTGGKPLSRQRACYTYDARNVAVRQSPCVLTDGDIAHIYQPRTVNSPCPAVSPRPVYPPPPHEVPPSGCGDPAYRSSYIDLGAAARVNFIVIRGCFSTCLVETSSDAARWAAAGGRDTPSPPQPSNGLAAFALAEVSARYVRVNGDFSRMTEISIWGPPGQSLPPPPEAPRPPSAGLSLGGNPIAPAGLSPLQFAGIVALNLVGLAVLAVIVVVVLRRRRRVAPPEQR
jgi:hypothetical protein